MYSVGVTSDRPSIDSLTFESKLDPGSQTAQLDLLITGHQYSRGVSYTNKVHVIRCIRLQRSPSSPRRYNLQPLYSVNGRVRCVLWVDNAAIWPRRASRVVLGGKSIIALRLVSGLGQSTVLNCYGKTDRV